MNEKSGAARIVEAMVSAALLNCKCGSRNSLVEKVKEITGNKFDVSVISGPKDMTDKSGAPFVVSLLIGDTHVFIVFTINADFFIKKIEVEESELL